MLERSPSQVATPTRAGVSLTARRVLFGVLATMTMIGMLDLVVMALSPGGFGLVDLLLALFAVTLPWIVIGFWNAVIGFVIMRFARDPVAAVNAGGGADRAATSRSPPRPRSCSASATNCPTA